MTHAHSQPIVARTSVPEACVQRLSLYLREFRRLERAQVRFVSSGDLARVLQLTDAQVRRDFSYFGQFGVSGRGYEVRRLQGILATILGLEGQVWPVALAGVGNLGAALLAYRGFRERGFHIRVAFDQDPRKIGTTVRDVPVASATEIPRLVRQHRVKIGVIAVPSDEAQAVCDRFVAGGVRAILNFAPVRLRLPPSVRLRNVDLALELEQLAFYLGGTNGHAGRPAPVAAAAKRKHTARHHVLRAGEAS